MWVLSSRKPQPGHGLPLVGTGNRHKGATEIAPLLIVRDESHRLSLGGLLSSRARLRFARCVQFAMKEYGRSRNFQRTANSVLTVCVSRGDKRKHHRCSWIVQGMVTVTNSGNILPTEHVPVYRPKVIELLEAFDEDTQFFRALCGCQN